jgi:hypothetical protein
MTANQSAEPVTPAKLRNIADWLMNGCNRGQAAVELRILAQDLERAHETGADEQDLKNNRDWLFRMLDKLVVAVETGVDVTGTAARCRSLLRASDVMHPEQAAPETPASHRLDGFGDCRNPGCTYPSVSNWDASKCESSEKAGEKHG